MDKDYYLDRMNKELNEKIEKALMKLYDNTGSTIMVGELYDEPINFSNAVQTLDDILQEERLIKAEKEARRLTSRGMKICTSGGWLKYLEREKSELSVEQKTKQLTLEKLEYEQIIRDQEQRIRNLTESLKAISLIKKYWWLITASMVLGVALHKIVSMYF